MDATRSRGIAVGVFALMDEFGFQGAEDALDWCIAPAVWLAAHRWGDDGGLRDVAVIAGSVLTAAIRVMDQARPRTAPLDGHGQCGHSEYSAHMLAHCPANYLSGEQVEDHGQVERLRPSSWCKLEWHLR